ncbi:MAG: dephospho-CoA kinase [Magnetococcales bacterium]|nr:dephospho-CoA kinase [Magnetococcales bacterium]
MLTILGVTGSIGCGKSTVTRLLGELGAHTLDADLAARQALAPGSPILARVADAFGADLLLGEGPPETRTLDRVRLAERIFADPDQRRRLEALVHPQVFRTLAMTLHQWDLATPAASHAIAALEIPLLFETGSDSLCDAILVVTCGERQQERLASRHTLSPTTRQQIIAQQWPEIRKCQRADFIIDNGSTPDQLSAQLQPIWETLRRRSDDRSPAWPHQWLSHLRTNG